MIVNGYLIRPSDPPGAKPGDRSKIQVFAVDADLVKLIATRPYKVGDRSSLLSAAAECSRLAWAAGEPGKAAQAALCWGADWDPFTPGADGGQL